MATKAARGALVPLGHAEDFGPVVAYMAQYEPSQLSCLKIALEGPFAPAGIVEQDTVLMLDAVQTIIAAPIARDLIKAGEDVVRLCNVDAPDLLHFYCATFGDVTCAQDGDDFILRVTDTSPGRQAIQACDFPDDIWQVLADFAAQTYVPATEASRLAGAGAGLTDND